MANNPDSIDKYACGGERQKLAETDICNYYMRPHVEWDIVFMNVAIEAIEILE